MANEIHLLLNAIGGYTDPQLSAETWQVGVRLALVFGTVDPVGILPNNWAPSAATVNRTETNWTITSNWRVSAGSGTFNPDDYLNDQAAPAFSSWVTSNYFSSPARLNELKLFPIGAPTGRSVPAPPYAQGSPCLLTWTANHPTGTGSGNPLPLQVAAVMSHRTSQIGRHGRGRMFMPALSTGALDTHGLISSAAQTAMVTAQVALLEALKLTNLGVGSANIRPIIVGKPWTNYAVINRVQADNIPDTQRRRRRSLVGSIVGADVSY